MTGGVESILISAGRKTAAFEDEAIAQWAAASAACARVSVLRLTRDEGGDGVETVAAFHAFGEACRRRLPLALARREHLRERLLRDARERLRAGELRVHRGLDRDADAELSGRL